MVTIGGIIGKFDVIKQQDQLLAKDFSRLIGDLIHKPNSDVDSKVLAKTVDLVLNKLDDNERLKRLIHLQIIDDYPQIDWPSYWKSGN